MSTPRRRLPPESQPAWRSTRRGVLRTGAALLALPWLESLGFAADLGPRPRRAASIDHNRRVGRVVFCYTPNGLVEDAFRPAAAGPLPELLPPTLEPLRALRLRLQVASGLTCDKARANGDGPGDHARAAAAWLTGTQPLKSDGRVRLARSADQVLAASLRGRSRFDSLCLSLDPGRTTGQCDSGYSCAYQNHVSWVGPERPAALHTDPARLFDHLFRTAGPQLSGDAAERRDARRARLLERLRGETRRLARGLSGAAPQRLEQYLDGLDALERRFASGGDPRVEDAQRPAAAEDRTFSARADDLGAVLALALDGDQAPVATWMLGSEGSNRRFTELGLDEGHHGLSHHANEPAKLEALRAIDRLHVERLARFATALAERPMGESDLLAHTLIVVGCGIRDGNAHDHHNLPVLLLGGEALELPEDLGLRGRHRVHPRETPFAALLASILEAFGAGGGPFGDAPGPLEPGLAVG